MPITKPGHEQVQMNPENIPKERLEILARPVLKAVRAAFEDPQFRAEYEDWLAKREASA